MEIHFKSAHTEEVSKEVTSELTAKAQRKILGLKKHLGKTNAITQVYVELGKATESHQNGNVWRVQINLDSLGKRYHADRTGETIQNAIDAAVNELGVELRKAKKRNESLLRKGGSTLKSFMRGFTTQ